MAVLTILSILATTFIFTTQANAETTDPTQNPNITKAMDIQAKCMASTGRHCIVDTETLEIKDELISSTTKNNVAENLPRKFDLRNCDIYNQGVKKNYVTSVKNQGKFLTCWCFAKLAAIETSILSNLNQNATYIDENNKMHDTIDLSERHLEWFTYSPVTRKEDPNQAGEGTYSIAEEQAACAKKDWLNLKD